MSSNPDSGLQIDADFPGGNIIFDGVDGEVVHVRQDLRDSEWWFYWYFRARGCAGRSLVFEFGGENSPIGTNGPAVSTDGGRAWSWMGLDCLRGEASFEFTFPDPADDVRFCFAIPYLEENLKSFLGRYADNVSIAVEELCRTRKGRSVELLRLGKLEGRPAHRILVTVRHHACEMIASYVLEGWMETVLSDNGDGEWYRENVEMMVVPFVDKDGVQDGDQGKLRKPHDHNRDYAGESIYPSTAALRKRVPGWSNGILRAAVDLHCPHIRGKWNEFIYMVGSPDKRFWREQCRLGSILERVRRGPLPYRAEDNLPYGVGWNKSPIIPGPPGTTFRSYGGWAREELGAKLTACFEVPYAKAREVVVMPESARAFGRDLAVAIREYLSDNN
ncbi:MAG: peptidase M14 [Theionarchaea archaeon]|nr:peptidase M14 [Theionarchaea archaeon]